MNDFIDYILTFYGVGGIYDINATRAEAIKATEIRMIFTSVPFEGDSIDRELVRDIILKIRGD